MDRMIKLGDQANVLHKLDFIQDLLEAGFSGTQKRIVKDPKFEFCGIPVKNTKHLVMFDRHLNEEKYLEQVIIRLVEYVDKDSSLKKCVKHLLEKILPYNVTVAHSWSGKSSLQSRDKTKICFANYTGFLKLIKRTIQYKRCEDDEAIRKAIVEYLKRSTQNKKRTEVRNEPYSNDDTSTAPEEYSASELSPTEFHMPVISQSFLQPPVVSKSTRKVRHTVDTIHENFAQPPEKRFKKAENRQSSHKINKKTEKLKSSTKFLLNKMEKILQYGENEDDVTGQHVSNKLKKLPTDKKVFAEKLIMEILYQAELGKVDEKTFVNYTGFIPKSNADQ